MWLQKRSTASNTRFEADFLSSKQLYHHQAAKRRKPHMANLIIIDTNLLQRISEAIAAHRGALQAGATTAWKMFQMASSSAWVAGRIVMVWKAAPFKFRRK